MASLFLQRILPIENWLEEEKQALQYRLNAVRKVEAIATLAGGIAHQFNNKISAIIGYLDLANMNCEDRVKLARYFDSMRESAESMTQLTEQLLAYARGGKYRVKKIVVSDFIRDTLPILQHSLKDLMVLDTELPSDIWECRGGCNAAANGAVGHIEQRIGSD